MKSSEDPKAGGSGGGGEVEVLYSVLGLAPGAAEEEVRMAYRRLAMRYHPDGSGDPATARQFARVVRAYKILKARASEPPRAPVARAPRDRFALVLEAEEDLFSLGQILASDPDPRAREAATRRLGLSGRRAAYVFLRRAFYDSDEAVALAAVRAVAFIGSRQAGGEVAALYSRSGKAMRERMLEAAAATKEPLFKATLEAAAADADPSLRARAARISRELDAALDSSP
ncbi:MAG TPA: J domain-containing protein [Rectinemataceae bacterium]|nr:J domain-containing protein [Rectinemataceae bacterium]